MYAARTTHTWQTPPCMRHPRRTDEFSNSKFKMEDIEKPKLSEAMLLRHLGQERERLSILVVDVGHHADVHRHVAREPVLVESLEDAVPIHRAAARGQVVVHPAVVIGGVDVKNPIAEFLHAERQNLLLGVQVR